MLFALAALVSSCSTCKRTGNNAFENAENPQTDQIVQYRMTYTGTSNSDMIIDLLPGESTFVLEYTGNENFVVNLATYDGKFIETLASANGKWKGVKKYKVDTPSPYLLQIRTNGPWNIGYY